MLDCSLRGGVASLEREAAWSDGRLYAAVKRWHSRESELIHRRPQHTLVMTLSGGTSVTGNQISGTATYEGADRAGCVSYVPASAERRGWYRDANMDFIALLISPSFPTAFGVDAGDLAPFVNRRDAMLGTLLRGLAAEMRAEAAAIPSLYTEHLAALALAHIARSRARANNSRPARGLSDLELARVIEFVEASLARDLSLGELAAVLGMRSDVFARRFRASTGMAPYRHVLDRRVARAKEWLAHGRRPLAEIAFALGFSSQSHFTNRFRRAVGLSPGEYRRQRSESYKPAGS
jgi:AraC family transcriptional regulator